MDRGEQVGLRIDLLGGLRVRLDDSDVDVGGPKTQAILVMLAHHLGESVGVDTLIEVLWGEHPPPSAKNAVQVKLSGLRKALHHSVEIEKSAAGYTLAPMGVLVDGHAFERLVLEAEAQLAEEPAAALELVDNALALWRGRPAAAELDIRPLEGRLTALSELHTRAQLIRLDARLDLGGHVGVCSEAAALADDHPYREDVRARHMLALYRSGRQVEALGAFRQTRELLVDELGLEPGPDLQALHRQILEQDTGLDHESAAPALSPTTEAALPRDNLRAEPNMLIERPETATVFDALEPGRVVTLVGTGGIGKSRCVTAVARRCLNSAAFDDGVWIIDLAPLPEDSDAVTEVAATAMGLGSEPGVSMLDSIVGYLRNRGALLVLDNCEHVAPSAAAFADAIAVGCPQTAVLAASRVRLGLLTEKLVTLGPLADDAGRRLLAGRIAEAGAGPFSDDDCDALCAVLDNYPLAIELAAARTRVLGPREIAERLAQQPQLLASSTNDRFAHGGRQHADLATALDWSLQRLSERSRNTLERAAVFVSDFDLNAAEAVLATDTTDAGAVVEDLGELVEQHLVNRDHGRARFRVLEPIRQHLCATSPATITGSYRDHFASFAVDAAKGLRGPDEAIWWNRWRAELPHVREIVRVATEQRATDLLDTIMSEMAVTIAICAVIEPGEWAITALERLDLDPLDVPGVSAAAAAQLMHLGRTDQCDALLDSLETIDDPWMKTTTSCLRMYCHPTDTTFGPLLHEHAQACDDQAMLVLGTFALRELSAVEVADDFGNPTLRVSARQLYSALHLPDKLAPEARLNKEELYRIALTSNNQHTIAEGQMFMALQHCFDNDPRRAGPLCVEMLERMERVRSDFRVWHGVEAIANMLAMLRLDPFVSEMLWTAVTTTGHLPFSRMTRDERLPVWVAGHLTDEERRAAQARGCQMDRDEAAAEARKAAEAMSVG